MELGLILEKVSELEVYIGALQAKLDQITKAMKEMRDDLYAG